MLLSFKLLTSLDWKLGIFKDERSFAHSWFHLRSLQKSGPCRIKLKFSGFTVPDVFHRVRVFEVAIGFVIHFQNF